MSHRPRLAARTGLPILLCVLLLATASPAAELTLGESRQITADAGGYHRLAALRPFRLPGGERAVTEPRRAAFGLLAAAFDNDLEAVADLAGLASFTTRERAVLTTMTERGLNAPWTSSVAPEAMLGERA